MLKGEVDLISEAKMVLDFNWTGSIPSQAPDSTHTSGPGTLRSSPLAIRTTTRSVLRESSPISSTPSGRMGSCPNRLRSPLRHVLPGIEFWHADEESPRPTHVKTSGIVQPPVHATAALRVYQGAKNTSAARAFLEYAFPRLAAWHEFLYRERDPEGEGLVYVRHPLGVGHG